MRPFKRSDSNRNSFSLRRFIQEGVRAANLNARFNASPSDEESGISKTPTNEKQVNERIQQIELEQQQTPKAESQRTMTGASSEESCGEVCPICYQNETLDNAFFNMDICEHSFCTACLIKYLKNEINESRTDIACPQCSATIHPNNIKLLLKNDKEFILKYEDFMIRRYLVTDPDARWCPAPDCSYAVIATGCASCPQIQCQRPECGVNFCYHCKAEWHPDQTCDAARSSRYIRRSSLSFELAFLRKDVIKPCPRCQVLIAKMNDGSCNHMVCAVCGAEFCWLCMKEVSDLHYLSPSGCTFWGKKPWSRKKKILWQLATLIGAPVGIALLAGIAIPSMVIGIPVWVGRKLLERYKTTTKHKRNISVIIGVTASILISPAIAGLAIAIGVPILLFYVYGIVPVSLCRAGCASSPSDSFQFDLDTDDETTFHVTSDQMSMGAYARAGGDMSVGDASSNITSNECQATMQSVNAICSVQDSCQESTGSVDITICKKMDSQPEDAWSENFSAITANSDRCVLNDNLSTKGLAGSIVSCKQTH